MTSKKEKAMRRIKHLRKMTQQNGASEQEAITAMNMMNKLLVDYNLSLSEIELDESDCVTLDFNTNLKKEHPSVHVVGAISSLTQTRATISKLAMSKKLVYSFFGLPHDTEIAVFMVEVVFNAMEDEYKKFLKEFKKTYEYKNRKAFHINAIKNSFQIGMAVRIIQRIGEMHQQQQEAYSQAETGTDLIVLKDALVDEEFSKKYKDQKLKNHKSNMTVNNNPTVLQAGFKAGDNVQLNRGVNNDAT